jgi:hypothetical protein
LVPESQKSLDSGTGTNREFGTIRLLLSEAASKHLTDTGHECFIVLSKVLRGVEEPATMGRWAISLVPCSMAQAQAVCNVALGSYTARPLTERQKVARNGK